MEKKPICETISVIFKAVTLAMATAKNWKIARLLV